jgi:hypothetical protein
MDEPAERPGPGRRALVLWFAGRAKRELYAWVAAEVSRVARISDLVVGFGPERDGADLVFEGIEHSRKSTVVSAGPGAFGEEGEAALVLLNGNLNSSSDVQGLLEGLRPFLARRSRVAAVIYNPYLSWLYRLADRFGLRDGPPATTFLTRVSLEGLARLSGYEVVRYRPAAFVPFRLLGIGTLLNMVLPAVPGLRWLGLVTVALLRPLPAGGARRPSLSIVIPARNEKGNIEAALERLPSFGAPVEVLFVEGHSTDGTWEEIERVAGVWDGRAGRSVRTFRQPGAGKADAVRLGFSKATGDLVTILDADLTMPPELLPRFYEAWVSGVADFVNGSRLVYPMEGESMRFLNRIGNVAFAKALSFVVDARFSDTLCGTKLLARADAERLAAWRREFGDFDPFGDFELLFPAASLGLGTVDVPIAYRARTYGTTNISRFRHGLQLLRMTLVGLFRLKLATRPRR